MNYSTAIFLVNSAVRAIAISYEPDPNYSGVDKRGKQPFYTFKTLDQSITKGDLVVVSTNTRWGQTVVRVEDVDLEIDFDSDIQLKWVVGSVPQAEYDAVLRAEADAIAKIRSAEKRRKQDELREKLIADNPELSGLSNVTALPPPPAEKLT